LQQWLTLSVETPRRSRTPCPSLPPTRSSTGPSAPTVPRPATCSSLVAFSGRISPPLSL
jgi:hypothetical protein